MNIYTKQHIHLNQQGFNSLCLSPNIQTSNDLNRTLFGHDETKFHLNIFLKDYKGEKHKHIEIFSLEGFFLIDKNVIYKLNVIDVEPIVIDELTLDLSTETREIVYQIPNIHILVHTLSFSVLINKKIGLSFVFEEKYDKNDKIGENYYFLAEKCDEQIKMCIYEFLSSLH